MKALLLGGVVAAVLGYAWFSRGEANVYPMSVQDTYSKLTGTKIESDYSGVLGKRDISISGNGENVVYWRASGAHATTRCQADLTPEGSSSTRINAYCDGGSLPSGAAAGMLHGMMRQRIIEHIDATLTDRPFDKNRARGQTAGLWPKDVRQPDASLGTAVNDAIKMDRDMKKMIGDIEKTGREMKLRQEMEYRSQSTRAATQPMVDLRN
jgi:hypothetical protein